MNILFFITPKNETAYLYDDHTLEAAIGMMDLRHFTAVPVLHRDGTYAGTLTEGDLLHYINHHREEEFSHLVKKQIREIGRRWKIKPVDANADMEDLVDLAMGQNLVPVVDDQQIYIGIITRKSIIEYCYKHSTLQNREGA